MGQLRKKCVLFWRVDLYLTVLIITFDFQIAPFLLSMIINNYSYYLVILHKIHKHFRVTGLDSGEDMF